MSVATMRRPIAAVEPTREAAVRHPFAHIVVALDGSWRAEQVFVHVEQLAKAFGSKVTCVCAVEPIDGTVMAELGMPMGYVPMEPLFETQEAIRAEDATYLARVKDRLTRDGIDVQCEEPEGRAAEAIVAVARKYHADLIVMSTHGRSGLGRALLGSVADQVVRTAPCPVLVVRAPSEN